ncbi:MAG: diaminopimelate epimerase [Candidatus Glassbacteria bacterium]|nr:diaminopimelate epimerase [Candidatus Glassbacteria bacterium]
MEFVKMHGCGNDYLFVDCLHVKAPGDPQALSRRMSDRHFGAGADGLVLVLPADNTAAQVRMRMFNADGSEAQMCGNAVRCLAKLVYERGWIVRERMAVETLAGLIGLELFLREGKVRTVRADMGAPRFAAREIPARLDLEQVVEYPLEAGGREFKITCVSMGNPHSVIFLEEEVERFAVRDFGPLIENHPLFPERTNVEFINVRGPNLLRQRTWERGSGETLACGTGASAAAAAAILTGRCRPGKVDIDLNGGRLAIEWSQGENVMMTGPAEEVYTGCWPHD